MVAGSMTLGELFSALSADDELTWTCCDATGRAISPVDLAHLIASPFAQLTFDSRSCVSDTLFVCKGVHFKREYLARAAAAGSTCYLAQVGMDLEGGVPGIVVNDVRRAMARVACAFFDNPSAKLKLAGLTGTKGKTTVAYYVDSILRSRGGAPSALLTGLVIDDGLSRTPSHNTTPESVELQRCLANAVSAGCDAAVMEVSSQGLKYDRTLGTHFEVGLFTNIGEDHISPVEHPTFEDYFSSKLRLFAQCRTAVVNLETDRVDDVLAAARRSSHVLTYSTVASSGADVRLLGCTRAGEGRQVLELAMPGSDVLQVPFCGLGSFNVSNALAAAATCTALGVEREAMVEGLHEVHVPGRMERYDAPDGSLVGIVDYAHNEMSMEALLRCVREEFPGREVTVVFGSTGDRATHRRAGLGRAAGKYADRIIVTEDDPGDVPVGEIAVEIGAAIAQQGRSYTVIENREEAVRRAVEGARNPGVVVLAGKGAETCIRRANGVEPCKSDAELLCRELNVPHQESRL